MGISEDEAFVKFQRRIEIELTKHYRMREIIRTTIKYFGVNRKTVLSDSRLAPIVYIRYMIIYIASNVYGISPSLISKHMNYSPRTYYDILNVMKERVRSDARTHSDLENIRQRLIKVLGK